MSRRRRWQGRRRGTIGPLYCPRCRKEYSPARRFCPEDGSRLRSSISESKFRAKTTGRLGTILGSRYQIRGVVGRGATARIYLAEDLFQRRPAVVKILNPSQGMAAGVKSEPRLGKAMREAFIAEAKVAMSIAHANVVKIYDADVTNDGTPYIVMEPLVGETLGEYLRREKRMHADLALPLLRQAAAGLAAVHRAGVVHRDVKPDNVYLVGDVGEAFGVKIVDFGFAKASKRSRHSSAAGVLLGTIEYMAPEQVVSDPADPRSDQYAFGVVMFKALTGTLPFSQKDDMAVLAHQLLSSPPAPTSLVPDLDPRFETVILSALRKAPMNRYRDMDALLRDLDRILGTEAGDVTGAPLVVRPDRYEVQNDLGRDVARVLRDKMGGP